MDLGGHSAIAVHRETLLDLLTFGKSEVPLHKKAV